MQLRRPAPGPRASKLRVSPVHVRAWTALLWRMCGASFPGGQQRVAVRAVPWAFIPWDRIPLARSGSSQMHFTQREHCLALLIYLLGS